MHCIGGNERHIVGLQKPGLFTDCETKFSLYNHYQLLVRVIVEWHLDVGFKGGVGEHHFVSPDEVLGKSWQWLSNSKISGKLEEHGLPPISISVLTIMQLMGVHCNISTDCDRAVTGAILYNSWIIKQQNVKTGEDSSRFKAVDRFLL